MSLRGRHRHYGGWHGVERSDWIEHDHEDSTMVDDHNHFAYTMDINHAVVTLMFGAAEYLVPEPGSIGICEDCLQYPALIPHAEDQVPALCHPCQHKRNKAALEI